MDAADIRQDLEYVLFTKEQIAQAIEALGVSASIRGEALTLQQFAKLADILS